MPKDYLFCSSFNLLCYSVAQVASTASLVSSPTINTPTTLTVNAVMPLTSTSVSSLSFTGVYVCNFYVWENGEGENERGHAAPKI